MQDVNSAGAHAKTYASPAEAQFLERAGKLAAHTALGSDAVIATWDAYHDYSQGKASTGEAVGEGVGAFGGGYLGGAAAGALAGSFAGPVGIAVGAGVGALIGSTLGKNLGKEIGGLFD